MTVPDKLLFMLSIHVPSKRPWLCKAAIAMASRHSSGAVWESRWPSWAVLPKKPYGFRGRKAILNHASTLVSACPWNVSRRPGTLSNTTELNWPSVTLTWPACDPNSKHWFSRHPSSIHCHFFSFDYAIGLEKRSPNGPIFVLVLKWHCKFVTDNSRISVYNRPCCLLQYKLNQYRLIQAGTLFFLLLLFFFFFFFFHPWRTRLITCVLPDSYS